MLKQSRLVEHLKPGLFCPILQYLSGFQMVKTKWPQPFESQTKVFLTSSQNRFGIKKYFIHNSFLYKTA